MPTISFNHLTSLTSLREAPNGSIKRAGPEGSDVSHFLEPDFWGVWVAHFYGTGVIRQLDAEQQKAGWRYPRVEDWGITFPTPLCVLASADQNTLP